MSELRWNDIDDRRPEMGANDYLVIGNRGGLYLAKAFEGYDEKHVWFRTTNGRHIYPEEMLAWAEVPPYDGPEGV